MRCRVTALACALAWLAVGSLGCAGAEVARPLNIVVFLLDAARADHFGAYGYPRGTTPHIDALAREGVVFETVLSEAASTYPSTAALMTGQSPSDSSLLATQRLPRGLPTLAERIREAGYRTYGYSENPFITQTFGFERGFDRFEAAYAHERFAENPEALPEFDTGGEILRALDWTASESRPFFLYFHVLRPHNPYSPPQAFLERLAPGIDPALYGQTQTLLEIDRGERSASREELDGIIALYDANLAYGDALFGELWKALVERDLLGNTAVVVLADHGEGFFEHGRMLHTSTVYEEMIRVPAIARVPGVAAGRRVAVPLQLRELGQSLARLAGVPLALGEGMAFEWARAQAPPEAPAPAVSWTLPRFARAAVRAGDQKLILDVGSQGCDANPEAFFDLAQDPQERVPRKSEGNAAAAELAAHFRTLRAPACGHVGPDHGSELDPIVEAQLRSLGYLDD